MIGLEDGRRVHIRQASAFDAALLAALHAACFNRAGSLLHPNAWDANAMAQFIAGSSSLCLLASVGANEPQPAGFLIAHAAADEAELITVGVLADWRRRGVGRTLLQHAAASLEAAGVRRLFWEVDEENQPALALYRATGAEAVGRRLGYYEDGGNAAVFSVDLESCPLGPAAR